VIETRNDEVQKRSVVGMPNLGLGYTYTHTHTLSLSPPRSLSLPLSLTHLIEMRLFARNFLMLPPEREFLQADFSVLIRVLRERARARARETESKRER